MSDVVHQFLPGRKSSHHGKEEVRRDSANCTNRKRIFVLQQGLTGSDLLWGIRWQHCMSPSS